MKKVFPKLFLLIFIIFEISQVCTAQTDFLESGDEDFHKGCSLFEEGKFIEAKEKFNSAKGLYEAAAAIIDVTDKIKKCDEWIKKCNKKIKEAEDKKEKNNNTKSAITISVNRSNLSFPAILKEKKVVTVTSNAEDWYVANKSSWISSARNGNSLYIYCDQNNSDKSREGLLTIAAINSTKKVSIKISQERNPEIENSFEITDVEFANVKKDGTIITDFGYPLVQGEVQYLKPRMTYRAKEEKEITVFVTIRRPDGTVMKGADSPEGCSYKATMTIKKNGGSVKVGGWGWQDGHSYATPGVYTFELAYSGKIRYRKYVNIESTFLSISNTDLSFGKKGGAQKLTVKTNASNWTLYNTKTSDFKISKENNTTIAVTCNKTTSPDPKSTDFNILAGGKKEYGGKEATVRLTQEGNKTRYYRKQHFGISYGAVTKRYKYKDKDGYTKKMGYLRDRSMTGLYAGFHYEGYFLRPKFKHSIGIGAATGAYYELYAQKGGTQQSSNGDYYASYMEHNVYVPANLLLRLNLSEKWNIAFFGGVGANYGVGNKIEFKWADNDEVIETRKGFYNFEEDGIERFFMNLEYGCSVRWNWFAINAKFFAPLTDWSKDKYYSFEPVKEMSVGISFMPGGKGRKW